MNKTPLYDEHVKLGARMAPFGGWEMPIQYEGIIAEHLYTRDVAGLFDICHMGEFELSGPTAEQDLERLLTMSVSSIEVGQCKYGFLLNNDGGVIDDLTCYRLAADQFMLVVNAATRADDAAWITKRLAPATRFHDISSWTGKLDVQGPKSKECIENALGIALPDINYFRFERIPVMDVSCLASRTGYTGEWGYELYIPSEAVRKFWSELIKPGVIKPVGLGARDTLRLEVGYPLYGHELSSERSPVAAFGKNFVDVTKDFIGQSGVKRDLDKGTPQKLAGLVLNTKRAAREGDTVWSDGQKVGRVTSGSLAPSLGTAVALAYIDSAVVDDKQPVEVDIRGKKFAAQISKPPFYKDGTARKKKV